MTVGELREMLKDFDEDDEVEFLIKADSLDETYIGALNLIKLEMSVAGKRMVRLKHLGFQVRP